ncbi:MAG: DUF1800 domain-containing protein [Lysobacterales bacterium CG_4_9_14_3_um_filter_62_6]|nr:MAG: DUF1800 domain-containing protein [Xanthomonadales bacterium CG_4_9_14_3_um_filter_62_6]
MRRIGYNAWLSEQLALPFSGHQPYLDQIAAIPEDVYHNIRYEAWTQRALTAPDQLRQRVAFALSEILVTSDQSGAVGGEPLALAHYYDLLGSNAFGNYRQLLELVTLDPVMGHYLSMFGNEKPDLASNRRPDENYAREIMQLFSVGLEQLNLDGTPVDGDPLTVGVQPVASYSQDTIRGFAHVFTGWTWFNCPIDNWGGCGPGATGAGWFSPMSPNVEFHAFEDSKQLLNYSGVALLGGILPATPRPANPANVQPVRDDLTAALNNIFNHPNVGPFVSRRLIQRLVSSNPSPAYVQRVASVFNNNGSGVRGDLRAVVRAIVLDSEARARPVVASSAGKLREPLLRWTQVWRAFAATNPNNRFNDWYVWYPYYTPQASLHSATVFNFFLPDYAAPGADVAQAGLFSPEFQIETDTFVTRFTNFLTTTATWWFSGNPSLDPNDSRINIEREKALSANVEALLEHLDVLLMGGTMSPFMRTTLKNHLSQVPLADDNGYRRSTDALSLILTSPEFSIEK